MEPFKEAGTIQEHFLSPLKTIQKKQKVCSIIQLSHPPLCPSEHLIHVSSIHSLFLALYLWINHLFPASQRFYPAIYSMSFCSFIHPSFLLRSIRLSDHLSMYPSIHICIYSTSSFHLSLYWMHLPFYLSIYPPINPSIQLSIQLSIHPSIVACTPPIIFLSTSWLMHFYPLVYPSVLLSFWPSYYSSTHPY